MALSSPDSASYLVLARKYRPARFADLKGQDVLVRILSNSLRSGRIAHAFMLTGIRGVGKTTTARIIARALNCLNNKQGDASIEPCGTCENCLSIERYTHPDILEMDAASHTGVNDIREIIETVHYAPVMGGYKVYIIDEVHMLSNSAFNALLKTLEEPPSNVVFIFATTELQKVPATILSRCQTFDLRRLNSDEIIEHLQSLLALENITAEPDALALIARSSGGSVRDSLSLTDQAILHAGHENGQCHITWETVRSMLGIAGKDAIITLFEHLTKGEVEQAFSSLHAHYQQGIDLTQLVEHLLEITHLTSRARISADLLSVLQEEEKQRVIALANQINTSFLAVMWQMLLKGLQEVKTAPDALAAMEMLCIRIAHSAHLPTPAEVIKNWNVPQAQSMPSTPIPSTPAIQVQSTMAIAAESPVRLQPEQPAVTPRKVMAESDWQTPAYFPDLVEMFRKRQEPLLYHHLLGDAHLVDYSPPSITLHAERSAPKNLVSRLKTCLDTWSGMEWTISLAEKSKGSETLKQTADRKKQELKDASAQEPLPKAVLEAFPGAAIADVRIKESID